MLIRVLSDVSVLFASVLDYYFKSNLSPGFFEPFELLLHQILIFNIARSNNVLHLFLSCLISRYHMTKAIDHVISEFNNWIELS
jgi:hypothetical protein